MARQNREEPTREEKRALALINLKGKMPVFSFCHLMQTEGMPFGQTGLALSHNLFIKYLDDEEIKKYVIDSLKESEQEAARKGAGLYAGQANSKNIIIRGSAIINESIDSVYVSDITEILGINCSKYHETYVGDLNGRNASKEDKELYKRIVMAYQSNNMHTYMSEAMEENSKAAKGSLEELVA